MTQEYQYPATRTLYREEIKKSTFIVHIAHTPTIADAKAFIKSINQEYPDARHNCWAHVAGEPGGSHVLGFSDDGEPNGTAGKPMLNVLMGSGLGEITAVITRYFGGIKLGTGGLVRAYGGSLNNALSDIELLTRVPMVTLLGESSYALQGVIEQHINSQFSGSNIEKEFSAIIAWQIAIDERNAEQAIKDIYEISNGAVELKVKQ
ncbi:IMPACT family member YigZ [Pseudoalteromonas sp. P1-9]|uniref:YigZ family protein n=1 Tax=Pseudoalteromonas sp. P1-9 TaxID=1710354 RepID=UPI0006D619AC|nr:YigZ family protein [Pseudoalteromonas sp. P1-9]KPV96204.1 IMPACT family member YigZ [Pseudoalteromonas sp. P1-9]